MLTRASWVKIGAIAVLCLCMCTGIASCSFGCTPLVRGCAPVPGAGNWSAVDYPNVGDAAVPASQVRNIELDWFAGRVEFNVVEDDAASEISWEESAGMRELRDEWRIRWTLDGDTLRIAYWESSSALAGCAGPSWPSKTLTLTVPKSACEHLGTVSIDAFSGDYNLDGLSCQRLEMDLASGRVDGSGTAFEAVDVEVASGMFNLDAQIADKLSLEMASGDSNITCSGTAPRTIDVSMASGNTTLRLPSDAGVTANVNKLSGLFNFDMPDSHTYDDSFICGDGATRLNVDMSSGNVNVTVRE